MLINVIPNFTDNLVEVYLDKECQEEIKSFIRKRGYEVEDTEFSIEYEQCTVVMFTVRNTTDITHVRYLIETFFEVLNYVKKKEADNKCKFIFDYTNSKDTDIRQ